MIWLLLLYAAAGIFYCGAAWNDHDVRQAEPAPWWDWLAGFALVFVAWPLVAFTYWQEHRDE